MKNLISAELNNKLFIRRSDNIAINQLVFNKSFLINSSKSFKLIKNIIELELLYGQRPKIIANYMKKSLVINCILTKNSYDMQLLPLLQRSPVLWKKFLYNFKLDNYYNFLPLVNNNSAITIKFNRLSKYQNWIKSAYLD